MSGPTVRYRNRQPTNNTPAVAGSNSGGQMDLQTLSQEELDALMKQGITPEQIAMYAQQQGQPIPPVILAMLEGQMGSQPGMEPGMGPGMPPDQSMMGGPPPSGKKSKKAQLSLREYANEQRSRKQKAAAEGAHAQTQYEYIAAKLAKEEQEREAKRTQGGFLIGVNLSNLFNMFRQIIIAEEKGITQPARLSSKQIYKRTGEWMDVNLDNILDREMGFRGSDITLLPEKVLDQNSSFQDVIEESRKYAQSGFDDKITPFGLLIMTRMLYKYRANNAQWLRVATILELIYKYLAGDRESREKFFKNQDDIEMQALLELEEFYNTDHLFMTAEELAKFKKDLDFYKYDPKINIGMQIKELKNKPAPLI